MRLVFTPLGDKLDSPLDPSFGRARNFLVYDLQAQAFEIISNKQNLDAVQGARIQSAETIAKAGANALITGHCGPKAFSALDAGKIKVFNSDALTVADALARRGIDRGQGSQRRWALGMSEFAVTLRPIDRGDPQRTSLRSRDSLRRNQQDDTFVGKQHHP